MNNSCRSIKMRAEEAAKPNREAWVDNVKVLACILVVLGHFFQSMVQADRMAETELYAWFNTTIYYFHVPLFFLCSGYLFQKTARINSMQAWGSHVLKKALSLGIPYFIFSTVTWLLKNVFSGAVNSQNDPYFTTLFLAPASPYWYLYALFFLFLFAIPFSGKRSASCGLCAAFAMKLLAIYALETHVYAVETVLENAIWFVLGMCLCTLGAGATKQDKRHLLCGALLLLIFLLFSVLVRRCENAIALLPFLMGLLGCAAVVLLVMYFSQRRGQGRTIRFLTHYTMPVFLMHTIFAAGLRSVLMKANVTSLIVHIALGLAISILGPILATIVLEKCKPLDFVLYPTKYIRLPKAE